MKLLPYLEAERLEAGADEVGRGCLCGPVVAAAVILPNDFAHELINDSKKLSKANRERLVDEIKENATAWAVAESTVEEIDEINILNASFLAMTRAVQALTVQPEHLLIDGNRFKSQLDIPYDCIIKGDGKYASIAAASILAKVHRDKLMATYAEKFPGYGWERNVGYPTKEHREGITKLGTTPLHRQSFKLLPDQLEIKFNE
ncbi:ribonuclease HII [Echinicola vietnamensis]|uniref:Ribonuclease HII n=1 Tax=Echinicola vietnamensis (strain DSM 17526 / LMG 23754 / KMM 6221) TaxID=926556 RepID=L0FXN0_ECHVK|nr:ribonuclease HII [Echinicola vietnamensis]AGA78664.1 ribonuclease HII [Echinicola vietnamensis DSM 17526]